MSSRFLVKYFDSISILIEKQIYLTFFGKYSGIQPKAIYALFEYMKICRNELKITFWKSVIRDLFTSFL